jgi:hypothetical protein
MRIPKILFCMKIGKFAYICPTLDFNCAKTVTDGKRNFLHRKESKTYTGGWWRISRGLRSLLFLQKL